MDQVIILTCTTRTIEKKKPIRFKIGGISLCNQFFLDYVVVITKATNSKINKIWIYLTKTEIEIIEYEDMHTLTQKKLE